MCRIASTVAVASGIILIGTAGAGAEAPLSVRVFQGGRPATATAEASGVAPYTLDAPYQVYSSSLVVRALPSSKTEDDVVELKKAFGLRQATLIHETDLSCDAPPAGTPEGTRRTSVSKSFEVETEGRVFGLIVVTSDTDMAPGHLRVKIFEHAKKAPAEGGAGAFAASIPSSYTVDTVISLDKVPATVLGFTDSSGTPRFVVFRRGA